MKKTILVIFLIIILLILGLFFIFINKKVVIQQVYQQISKNNCQVLSGVTICGKLVGSPSFTNSCRYPVYQYASWEKGYFENNYKIYFYDGITTLIPKADFATFECLPSSRDSSGKLFYGKDKNNVYMENKLVLGADPKSFGIIGTGYFSKDAGHVFAEGVLIPDADAKTFKIGYDYWVGNVWTHFATDKDNVFVNQKSLHNSDPSSFAVVGLEGFGFYKDKNNVYYIDDILPGADPATFVVLKDGVYYKDKNSVYYKNQILPKADASTFKVISVDTGDYLYAYDKNYYFKNNQILGSANSPKFRVINGNYLLDGNNLLWDDQSMLISDPKNLVYIAAGYFDDGKYIYSTNKDAPGEVDGLASGSIKTYTSDYPTEVYFIKKGDVISLVWDYIDYEKIHKIDEQLVKDANAQYFVPLKWPYAKDDKNVFYISYGMEGYYIEKIEGADPQTFKFPSGSLPSQYSTDANHVYLASMQLEDADPNIFYLKKINGFKNPFGVSDKNVYFGFKKLKGIDPDNITVEQDGGIISSPGASWYLMCVNEGSWYISELELERRGQSVKNYKVDQMCLDFIK